jgi:hypothetical protein
MSLLSQPLLQVRLMSFFLFGEDAFVVWLAGGNKVENDSGKFVSGCCDCLWRSELGSHPPVKQPKTRLAVV